MDQEEDIYSQWLFLDSRRRSSLRAKGASLSLSRCRRAYCKSQDASKVASSRIRDSERAMSINWFVFSCACRRARFGTSSIWVRRGGVLQGRIFTFRLIRFPREGERAHFGRALAIQPCCKPVTLTGQMLFRLRTFAKGATRFSLGNAALIGLVSLYSHVRAEGRILAQAISGHEGAHCRA